MCDSGARYTTTYDDDAWLAEQGIDIGPYLPVVERAWNERVWDCPQPAALTRPRSWSSAAGP